MASNSGFSCSTQVHNMDWCSGGVSTTFPAATCPHCWQILTTEHLLSVNVCADCQSAQTAVSQLLWSCCCHALSCAVVLSPALLQQEYASTGSVRPLCTVSDSSTQTSQVNQAVQPLHPASKVHPQQRPSNRLLLSSAQHQQQKVCCSLRVKRVHKDQGQDMLHLQLLVVDEP